MALLLVYIIVGNALILCGIQTNTALPLLLLLVVLKVISVASTLITLVKCVSVAVNRARVQCPSTRPHCTPPALYYLGMWATNLYFTRWLDLEGGEMISDCNYK